MRTKTVAGTRVDAEPVRSTAYYYGDLEKLKTKNLKDSIRPYETHITDNRGVEHVKLKDVRDSSLSEHIKWQCETGNESLSLSEHLKWRECPDIDPVLSLTERLKWRKIDDERNAKLCPDPLRWKEPFTRKANEKLKRKNILEGHHSIDNHNNPNALSEYVDLNEIINDGPVKEIPPFRDRKYSVPEYSTPENSRRLPEDFRITPESSRRLPEDFRSPDLSPETSRRVFGETYSTAGTFPMPETKEKEPLLAELEVVGRVPLSQLDNHSGVRRSRSWYLCCPNVPDEDISRESSWRYSSLRPVTVPPPPGQNGLRLAASVSTDHQPDSIRAERDALAQALSAERQRAAAAARAHDARLAELHGVIAELVRRRALDKQTRAIPEEEVSDECDSTTQPAGEFDIDADQPTDQNDTSSMLSPDPEVGARHPDCNTSGEHGAANPRVDVESPSHPVTEQCDNIGHCDNSGHLSDKDNELCLDPARCCQSARCTSNTSCEREHGSADGVKMCPVSPGRSSSRQAKLASRVRLKRTEDPPVDIHDDSWCAMAAEKLSLDVCAQADYREALVAAGYDGNGELVPSSSAVWRVRCLRAQADCHVLRCALQRATDTAHRLSTACAVQESSCVMVCGALRSADAALECYDVLLALAETKGENTEQRAAAEQVANQLLTRLESVATSIGQPLMSAGPWMEHDVQVSSPTEWSEAKETCLRAHAARLKAETVALRGERAPPKLFSYHDSSESESCAGASMVEMETAVALQDALAVRERLEEGGRQMDSLRNGRRDKHWLDAASETDL